jgi:hypothetical protein
MTDTRNADPTTQTDTATPDPEGVRTDTGTADPTTQTDTAPPAESANADRAAAEADARGREAVADDRSTERLSTAAIVRDGADELETAAPEREPDARRSNMPEPKVAPLFSDDAAGELRERWTDVQAGFVDEPKSAVEQADALVAEVMKRLADSFATERNALEHQWSRGDDASTEDLRMALRRYHSFFDRLLSI